MSKSAIYAVNTAGGATITAGGVYPITQVVRRFGCDIAQEGSGIALKSPGYYKVNGMATVVATGAGIVTATLLSNGVAVPGATSSVTAEAGATVTLPLDAIVRVNCCGNLSQLTVAISAESTSVNAELSAFKL